MMNQKKEETGNDRAGMISETLIESMERNFETDPLNRMRQNALAESEITKLALNQRVMMGVDRNFSTRLDDWDVTNQKKSGRCWLFSAVNLLRVDVLKKLDMKDFEFSQNWLLFWDKFEKANYFLEAIIETADRDTDDRTVVTILSNCTIDGGQWNMAINIIMKYGLVPKSVMPETLSSSATAGMNAALTGRLRVGAMTLRDLYRSESSSSEKLRKEKQYILDDVYRILRVHLGNPPTKFDWQWSDSKKTFHREKDMTPATFRDTYVSIPLNDYVAIVHDPRKSSPVGRVFTVEYLGNVVGGGRIIYLNVDIQLMKSLARQTLKNGEAVWFGCDCGKMFHRENSIWDASLFEYDSFYNMELELQSKEDRLLYRRTAMNHAMLFTGIDEDEGEIRKWRVENSWGDGGQGKGFYVMNDNWFDEYMFEIAVRKDMLPADLQKALEEEPIVLPAWDPMGALAK